LFKQETVRTGTVSIQNVGPVGNKSRLAASTSDKPTIRLWMMLTFPLVSSARAEQERTPMHAVVIVRQECGEDANMVNIPERNASVSWTQAAAEHWRLFLIEGVVLIALGMGAILIPVFASLAVAIFLGWLLLMGGVVGAATTLAGRHAPGFWWSLVSAIITIIAGLLLIGWPVGGAISLTLVLAAYLATEGVVSMLYAFEHRRQLTSRWGLLFFNGAIDVVLAALIVSVLPAGALWVIGLLLGIDFVFGGASLIAVALAARNQA
jgi:uncharacterized membrane protein HdeD (DUF308 family)